MLSIKGALELSDASLKESIARIMELSIWALSVFYRKMISVLSSTESRDCVGPRAAQSERTRVPDTDRASETKAPAHYTHFVSICASFCVFHKSRVRPFPVLGELPIH